MKRVWVALGGGLLLLSACAATGPVGASVLPSLSPAGKAITYVAVGASETAGIGATDAARDSWPQALYRMALPRAAVLYNLGTPGATVQQALQSEVPLAVDLHPDLVTVFLNVNDMLDRVAPPAYQTELTTLLSELRRDGQTAVLVANVPPLDRLPAYLRCAPFAPGSEGTCDRTTRLPVAALERLTDEFNAAIAAAAARTGAVVVDLHAVGLRTRQAGDEGKYVSDDGFHPSTEGHRLIAEAFAAALQASWPRLATASQAASAAHVGTAFVIGARPGL